MKLLTFIASVCLRLLVALVQRVPLSFALRLGEILGIISYWTVPKRRRIALENLQKALGEKYDKKELRALVWKMALNLGRNVMEFLRLPIMKAKEIDRLIEFVGLEHLNRALKEGKGVFVLTAHFGNWDLLAAAMAFKGYHTNLVTKYLKSKLLNTLWQDFRRRVKVNILYREKSLKDIIRRLKMNELIGFVLDQNTKRNEGVFVNFFGRPAATIPSLAILAHRLGTPVVPAFIIRKKGGYHRVEFLPPIEFQKKATLEESIIHNTQIYTDIIEHYIRRYPDHWIWLHRRWKTQPT